MIPEDLVYSEKISSKWTEALFITLTIVFALLFIWRFDTHSMDWLAVVLLCFAIIFLFYSLNYIILTIHLTSKVLTLIFGIFKWRVQLENVQECRLDEIPTLMKYGGAGIHFMIVHDRYCASFNFLEYPRVVIAFKRKVGLIRDLSFTTRQPEKVIQMIQAAVSAERPGNHE
jgi:hypothetical protein